MRTIAISAALRNAKRCKRRLASTFVRRRITRPDDKATLISVVTAYAWRSLWACLNTQGGRA